MSKLRVGIVFGGRSTEHEVSLVSAKTILEALDPARYSAVLIGIDHEGRWRVAEPESDLVPEAVFASAAAVTAAPVLWGGLELQGDAGRTPLPGGALNVVFPIVHGRGGEDGVLQGVLESAGVPYVGAGVASTALCMDKTLSKRVLRDADLPVLPSIEVPSRALGRDASACLDRIEQAFAYPLFVKPSNTGSSVGIRRVSRRDELRDALQHAARFDHHVLAEPAVDARELECAVLGGERPEASLLGEILSPNEFYDYAAKYVSDETRLVIPAPLDPAASERLRALALEAFSALKCWGMARVDFFVTREGGEVFVNELNTLPGFTDGSMYPRLWEASGIALPELVDRLIELALERHREAASLELRFRS
ncbi:MAG: D-alanine--D-alanine ligase family protein [Myxococcota bacterium]